MPNQSTKFVIITGLYAGLLFSACNKPIPVFESLPAAQTHIDFTNTLHAGPQFNILYYLYYYNGGGVAAGDINNDGLTDVYFTANHPAGNKLYLNKGNFSFEDITTTAGVAGTAQWSTGATMADVNGDGMLDIYTCAVGNQFGLTGSNELFLNKGNGKFEPAAEAYGIKFSGLSTQAAFFDYDHDGDLDLYLLNHSKRPHANIVDTANRRRYDSIAGDRMYRQDMVNGQIKFTDVSKEAGIYQSNLGYGLGIAVADFNNDGWDDIYIGNDFHENDYYYINNGNGAFTEAGAKHFGHYSRFSMGNDAADYNNDGQIDVVTVDMLPPDEKTLKTYGSDENPNNYKVKLGLNGYLHQYSRNTLQRNNGSGESFSDVALLNGVQATDWSWCPLFADFDNDGNKDLFVSSGIVKRPVDMDYVQFVSAMQTSKGLESTDKFDDETIAKMPDGSCHPFFFKGNAAAGFEPVSDAWGTGKMKGYFNGAAYADLDNDGDLDMVMNCINAQAVVLKNNSPSKTYLRIKTAGDNANTIGIGTKAYLFTNKGLQFQQLMPTRGFLSASEPVLHFGLGDSTAMDSLLIVWADQRFQVISKPVANAILQVNQKDAAGIFEYAKWFPAAQPLLEDITEQTQINWKHTENDFVDFNRQYLIPHLQSTRGPKVAVGDVNGDGLDDFYACGAHGQQGQLMLQTSSGTFIAGNGAPFAANAVSEEVDALFFDADGDRDLDLYVASGGYQYDDGETALNDHLYFNDGKAEFAERTGTLPQLLTNKSCVAAADVDADGDTDLFVGSLAHAGKYGTYQKSVLLINDGKGNMKVGSGLPEDENETGMITSALFADVNNDKRPDLIVAGEWMPVTIYLNTNGKWEKKAIAGSSGLWQTLSVADINDDGKPDLLAGNWGLNSKLANGKTGPLKMYVKDFDKNGREEQIVAYTVNGKEYTFLAKDELERALPVLKKAYLTYGEVAGETVQYMFFDLFKDYREWKAETLATSAFINTGNGLFEMKKLPAEWQLAPVFAFAASATSKTIFAGGNFYGVVPYEGRYDAMRFSAYRFGKGESEPVFAGMLPGVEGEVRDARWIKVKGRPALLVARNNMALKLLKFNDKR